MNEYLEKAKDKIEELKSLKAEMMLDLADMIDMAGDDTETIIVKLIESHCIHTLYLTSKHQHKELSEFAKLLDT